MNVYLIRHCKAEGQSAEAKLTDEGNAQAEKLADFLEGKGIAAIWTSPFVRTRQTIQPLAQRLGMETVQDQRLAERVLCEGHHPDWYEMLRETFRDLDLSYPGGESSRVAMSRGVAVIDEVVRGEERNVVIVTHGNLMALILKHFEDRIGFEEWAALSNPDVYHLAFTENPPTVKRIWTE
ncbi:histidine phosphatase family protein [Tumebacillus sp. DT12]|uniref:Histidine phosphatase family protein n=1 Tax=Tumebacillus lacus TaxID=2995335 RepID=A0ABT3X0F3_9BACL|nr:histidine phosphatase family protein [Tumebacillus lacus]MCX7569242.1 histidine phosphatase family protein [Tumebacillus lacus]